MAYSAFTTETVFIDQNVNIYCNRIWTFLDAEFTNLETKFCITGSVSRIIQGDSVKSLKVIPFISNDFDVLKYCANDLARLLNGTAIIFKNRVQLKLNGVYFEFWYVSNIGTINTISGLYVQDTNDIPSNIL